MSLLIADERMMRTCVMHLLLPPLPYVQMKRKLSHFTVGQAASE